MLLTTRASIERVGPEILMLKPLKWPWLNKTASSFDWANAEGAAIAPMTAATTAKILLSMVGPPAAYE